MLHFKDIADEVWVLELPIDVAKQRLMKRNSLSEADVRLSLSLCHQLCNTIVIVATGTTAYSFPALQRGT